MGSEYSGCITTIPPPNMWQPTEKVNMMLYDKAFLTCLPLKRHAQ